MSDKHSIAEARTNLPRLVREAESGKAVEWKQTDAGLALAPTKAKADTAAIVYKVALR